MIDIAEFEKRCKEKGMTNQQWNSKSRTVMMSVFAELTTEDYKNLGVQFFEELKAKEHEVNHLRKKYEHAERLLEGAREKSQMITQEYQNMLKDKEKLKSEREEFLKEKSDFYNEFETAELRDKARQILLYKTEFHRMKNANETAYMNGLITLMTGIGIKTDPDDYKKSRPSF